MTCNRMMGCVVAGVIAGSAGMLLPVREAVGQLERPTIQREGTRLPAVQRPQLEQRSENVLVLVMERTQVEAYQRSSGGDDRPTEQVSIGKATPKLMIAGPDGTRAAADGQHTLRDGTTITVKEGQIADAAGPSGAFIQAAVDPAGQERGSWSWGERQGDAQASLQETRSAVDMFLKAAAEEEEDPQAMQAGAGKVNVQDLSTPSVLLMAKRPDGQVELLACAEGKHAHVTNVASGDDRPTESLSLNLAGQNSITIQGAQITQSAGPAGQQLQQMAMEEDEEPVQGLTGPQMPQMEGPMGR